MAMCACCTPGPKRRTWSRRRGIWCCVSGFIRIWTTPTSSCGVARAGWFPGGEVVVANLEGSAALNALHARLAGVHGDVMPGAPELRAALRSAGWRVVEAIDEPDEYFLRARRD
jgi:hypothetical protein